MLYLSVVPECQDTGIRDVRWKKVAGPVYRRWHAVRAFLDFGEQIESTGLDAGLREAVGVGIDVATTRTPFVVPPCSLRVTSEAMDKDDTCWSACFKGEHPCRTAGSRTPTSHCDEALQLSTPWMEFPVVSWVQPLCEMVRA